MSMFRVQNFVVLILFFSAAVDHAGKPSKNPGQHLCQILLDIASRVTARNVFAAEPIFEGFPEAADPARRAQWVSRSRVATLLFRESGDTIMASIVRNFQTW